MDTNLGTIKNKVYFTFFQDGLWDMFLGVFLLAWGLTVWFDLPLLPGAVFILFFWLVLGLKQMITYPRIGYARPVEYQSRLLKTVITGIIALAAVIIFLLPLLNQGYIHFLRENFEFILNSSMAIAAALVGYWWSIKRWYAYALLILVFAVLYQWTELSYQVSFIIPGLTIFLSGLAVLIGFLRQYRVPAEENFDDIYR
jgi:hypothetical protein